MLSANILIIVVLNVVILSLIVECHVANTQRNVIILLFIESFIDLMIFMMIVKMRIVFCCSAKCHSAERHGTL